MDDKYWELSYRRILIIFGLLFLVFLAVIGKLVMVQVFEYAKYSYLATIQRQTLLFTNVLRGNFFDRHGKIIRGTKESWYLLIEKQNSANLDQVLDELQIILEGNFYPEYLKNKERAFWIYPQPLKNLQIEKINRLHCEELKIVANYSHQDSSPGIAWHLLGFADQQKGFSGLEYLYQPLLHSQGHSSSIFTINDGKQNYFRGLGLRTHKLLNPAGVVLTIDLDIQRIVDQIMDYHQAAGAIVVLDAKTGQILAMSSRPLVDFSNCDSISLADHPFINRAVAAFQPGSIFKLVTLCAGLDSGLLKPDDLFDIKGYDQPELKKWLTATFGNEQDLISLSEALAFSINPIFIEITMRLKPTIILEYADKFGLGQPYNIGLLDESWGELPSGIGLSDGEIANMALGQQNVYTTPLQIASLIQTIANDGVRCNPQLVLGSLGQKGEVLTKVEKLPPVRVIKSETARAIKEMMAAVVAYGTGTAAQLPGGVAGKTGTAQVGDNRQTPPHAWFAGFTPLKNPKYVAVVFCEKGVSGADTAAPIFKEVLEKVTRIRD